MTDPRDEKIAELEDMIQQLHERLYAVEQILQVEGKRDVSDILFGDGWVDEARKAAGWGTAERSRRGSRG